MCCDQCNRKLPRVGVGPQIAAFAHAGEPGAKQRTPLVIAAGQVVESVVVGFEQFPCQRPLHTSAASLPHHGDLANSVTSGPLSGHAIVSGQARGGGRGRGA
jgi:hypothetical protein